MIYRLVSAKVVLGRFATRFRLQSSDWIGNAAMWMFDGIEALGSHAQLEKHSSIEQVIGHRASMPCDLVSFRAIEYKGHNLPYSGDLTMYNQYCLPRSTSMRPNDDSYVEEIIPGLSQSTQKLIDGIALRPENKPTGVYFGLNPGYIITSFESGEIKLHYDRYPSDEDGWPMVPDNYQSKEALMWYMMYCILLGGVEHPTVNLQMAETNWERFLTKARNYNAMPDIQRTEMMRRAWVRMIPPFHAADDFFMGLEDTEKIYK